jgi:exodeoxyribonuclease-3
VKNAGNWIDIAREVTPEPEKIYTWWSYRAPDWAAANKGRRLDHIWVSQELGDKFHGFRIMRDARGWAGPSDHVPVTTAVEV